MTLKEKFESSDILISRTKRVNKQIKIADDYAVEFEEWVEKLRNSHLDSLDFNLYLDNDTKQLLEIFKKEKGL